MNVSEMKPPIRESKNVEPMKFVRVFAAPDRLKCNSVMKYKKKLTTLAINPIFSNATNPTGKKS